MARSIDERALAVVGGDGESSQDGRRDELGFYRLSRVNDSRCRASSLHWLHSFGNGVGPTLSPRVFIRCKFLGKLGPFAVAWFLQKLNVATKLVGWTQRVLTPGSRHFVLVVDSESCRDSCSGETDEASVCDWDCRGLGLGKVDGNRLDVGEPLWL